MLAWIKAKWDALLARLKGWRTVILNTLAASPFILDSLGMLDVSGFLGTNGQTLFFLGVIAMNIYLRSITDTAIGRSDGEEA